MDQGQKIGFIQLLSHDHSYNLPETPPKVNCHRQIPYTPESEESPKSSKFLMTEPKYPATNETWKIIEIMKIDVPLPIFMDQGLYTDFIFSSIIYPTGKIYTYLPRKMPITSNQGKIKSLSYTVMMAMPPPKSQRISELTRIMCGTSKGYMILYLTS